MQRNRDFSTPRRFDSPDNSKHKSFACPQSNTVILPLISQTIRFFKPKFVQSIGSTKDQDSTLYLEKSLRRLLQNNNVQCPNAAFYHKENTNEDMNFISGVENDRLQLTEIS